MSNLNKILDLIYKEAEHETNIDKVTGLYAVMVKINIRLGKRMEEMRNDER